MPDDERVAAAVPTRMSAVQWWQLGAFTACNCGIVLGNAIPASLRVALVATVLSAGLWALTVRYPRESITDGVRHFVSTHTLHGLGKLLFVMTVFFGLFGGSGDGRSLFFFLSGAMVFATMAAPRSEATGAASPP